MYSMLSFLWRIGLRIFFRKVEISGVENVPKSGPVLFVSNHLNAFVDGILFIALLERPVRITAKAALKKSPVWRFLLNGIGAITFARRQDGGSHSENKSALEEALQAIRHREQLLIFPEGFSHSAGELAEFKKGAAHLALEAANEMADFCVVPVGLVYLDKRGFRSDVVIQFGKGLSAGDVRKFTEVEALNQEMRKSVQQLCLEVPPAELKSLRWAAMALLSSTGRPSPLNEDFSLVPLVREMKTLADIKRSGRSSETSKIEQEAMQIYEQTNGGAVRPHELFLPLSIWRAVVFFVRELELSLIALLPALWGLVQSAPPYVLTRIAVNKTARDDDHVATHAIFLGTPIFLLFYSLQIVMAGIFLPTFWAIIYAVTLPYFSVMGLLYLDRLRDSVGRMRSYLNLAANEERRVDIQLRTLNLRKSIDEFQKSNSQ